MQMFLLFDQLNLKPENLSQGSNLKEERKKCTSTKLFIVGLLITVKRTVNI